MDTGANMTCIPFEEVPLELHDKICKTDKPVRGPDSKLLDNVIGYLYLNFEYKKKIMKQKAFIVKKWSQTLLGRGAIERFEFFVRVSYCEKVCTENDTKCYSTVDIKKEFPGIFDGIGHFKNILTIPLIENKTFCAIRT